MSLDYDTIVPKLCPGYERASSEFAARAKTSKTVIDLGVGAGLIAQNILKESPGIAYFGVDVDGDALKKAGMRLGGYRFFAAERDFTDFAIPPVDTVVSSLAIHHLAHDKQEALFGRIAKSSRTFLHFELVAPETEQEGKTIAEGLEAHIRREAENLGLGGADLQRLKEQSHHNDKPMKLSEHVRIYEKLGAKVDVVFKEYCFAFYATSHS